MTAYSLLNKVREDREEHDKQEKALYKRMVAGKNKEKVKVEITE